MPDSLQPMEEQRISVPEADAGGRLDRTLAAGTPLSRERVKTLIKDGRAEHLEGGAWRAEIDPAAPALHGDWRLLVPPSAPAEARPQAIPLDIVHEDEAIVVLNKPAGLVVHPGPGNPDGTLVNALLHHCAGRLSGVGGVERPGIVHRIDKDTSGLLVVTKTDAAHEALAEQFAAHTVERRYDLAVHGRVLPPVGTIDAPLGRSDRDRFARAVVAEGRGKRAVTHYRTVGALERATRLECRLETGRTHQVRVHLAHLGHPLIGDPLYSRRGGPLQPLLDRLDFRRQGLHAATLGFVHPSSGEMVRFQAELPADMQELFMGLALSSV